jgi:hypothetical protein
VSNSKLFFQLLRRLSESEQSQPALPIKSITVRGTFSGDLIFQASESKDMGTAYTKLSELLLPEGTDKRYLGRVLDSLPDSEFSVMQLIGGCATAIQCDAIRPSIDLIYKAARTARDGHLLQKNAERGAERAVRRSAAALVLNPTVSNAMRPPAVKDSAVEITTNRIGCALYPHDRLVKKKQPSTPALLAFHLEYLFRRWPVEQKTFPTYPPRAHLADPLRQTTRGLQPPAPTGKPRLDVIARLLTLIFPLSTEEAYTSASVKDFIQQMEEQGATYVGW